jgi:N-acetylglucosamine kinase-like BadF-type ATPase
VAGPLYLGIEGGATRTTGVLVGPQDTVVARRRGTAANVHAVGEEAARDAVAKVAERLLDDAGVGWGGVTAAALCLAGLRRPADRETWQQLAAEIGIGCPIHLTHDAAAGLAAGSPDGTGILVICGTGSLVYGRRADSVERTVGGRGPLLGDVASGFDIGHQALRRAAWVEDGGLGSETLARLLRERLGVEKVDELLPWLSPFAKDRVASVAPVVFAAARRGDRVAQDIVATAARRLASGVAVVNVHLWPPAGAAGRVVFAGGVLEHQAGFRKALAEEIADFAPDARCGLAEAEGAVGAARVARAWHEGRR